MSKSSELNSMEREHLQARLNSLVKWRHNSVEALDNEKHAINREFDREAAKINRRLRKFEDDPEYTPKQDNKKPPNLEGLTDEEKAHFLRLSK